MAKSVSCKSCGGELNFYPADSCLKCVKCNSKYSITKSLVNFKNISMTGAVEEFKINPKAGALKCCSCGAAFTGDKLKMSQVCEYCGSHLVEDFSKGGSVIPDAIIPYAFDVDEARRRFADNIKRKAFIPNVFKKSAPIENITSIYIPAFVFKCKSCNTYFGKLEKKESDSDGDYYRVFTIDGTQFCEDTMMLECSDFITQTTLEEIKPYDLQALTKFNPGFIMGYSVEHLNRTLSSVREESKQVHSKFVRRSILSKYSYDRVRSLDIKTEYVSSSYAYTIIPTYKISYTYKDRKYDTFMNGQTGKLCSNVPRSAWKICRTVFLILGAVAGLVYLFSKYL